MQLMASVLDSHRAATAEQLSRFEANLHSNLQTQLGAISGEFSKATAALSGRLGSVEIGLAKETAAREASLASLEASMQTAMRQQALELKLLNRQSSWGQLSAGDEPMRRQAIRTRTVRLPRGAQAPADAQTAEALQARLEAQLGTALEKDGAWTMGQIVAVRLKPGVKDVTARVAAAAAAISSVLLVRGFRTSLEQQRLRLAEELCEWASKQPSLREACSFSIVKGVLHVKPAPTATGAEGAGASAEQQQAGPSAGSPAVGVPYTYLYEHAELAPNGQLTLDDTLSVDHVLGRVGQLISLADSAGSGEDDWQAVGSRGNRRRGRDKARQQELHAKGNTPNPQGPKRLSRMFGSADLSAPLAAIGWGDGSGVMDLDGTATDAAGAPTSAAAALPPPPPRPSGPIPHGAAQQHQQQRRQGGGSNTGSRDQSRSPGRERLPATVPSRPPPPAASEGVGTAAGTGDGTNSAGTGSPPRSSRPSPSGQPPATSRPPPPPTAPNPPPAVPPPPQPPGPRASGNGSSNTGASGSAGTGGGGGRGAGRGTSAGGGACTLGIGSSGGGSGRGRQPPAGRGGRGPGRGAPAGGGPPADQAQGVGERGA